jgi:hypothetical protein
MKVNEMVRRVVFERAYQTMNKYGVDSFIYSKLNEKKDEIMKSMLDYYESTEEFEKCSFIVDFFNKIKEVELENKS